MNKTVLIVDDDRIIRIQLERELKRCFSRVLTSSNAEDALTTFSKERIDLLLLDVQLPDIDGLDLLSQVKVINPNCEVIVISSSGSDVAVRALVRGAIDYLEKPIDMENLSASIGRAQEKIATREGIPYQHIIMIIDDDKDIVARLSELLKKEGYQTFEAYSGDKGLELLAKQKVDVVITDVHMENMDGIEFLRQAKKFYQDVEVIMTTGQADTDFAVKSLREGAIDYLRKPLDIDELLAAIEKAIERIKLSRNSLYRNRELKISSEIVQKMNEELERLVEERTKILAQTQTSLFQTSKLAILGEMSTGLAHEINQPLNGISLVVGTFQKLLSKGKLTKEEIESGLADIQGSVKRMSRIILHIRTFARQETLKFVEINIRGTIESALTLLGEQLRLHNIELSLDFSAELPKMEGEPYQLEQVWINIISNARDAMDEKEERISKGIVSIPNYSKKLHITTKYNPETKMVEVCFVDNGIGMKKEQKQKIFEPFFTTKEAGKGTGLGMSISYGIIKGHKGKIEADGIEGETATLKVSLPVLEASAAS
ncbi:MAG: response regulator [Candidatus Riflebacteria bacterium]|nr:response regulator [Candidatus Riflebacteria bacterium]